MDKSETFFQNDKEKTSDEISALIQSPIAYTGSKRRLLPQILPLLPKDTELFIDLFCGSCSVAINSTAPTIWCNDNLSPLIDILKGFQQSGASCIQKFEEIIELNNLTKEDKEAFIAFRDKVRTNPTWEELYVLMCHSFNNQMRFNKKGLYNSPFGQRTLNQNTKENIKNFCKVISNKNVSFMNLQYYQLDLFEVYNFPCDNRKKFFYIDPPYYLSDTVYNDKWGSFAEKRLYFFLDTLEHSGYNFAMSNNLQMNTFLNDSNFIKKYHVEYLDMDYKNCSYHRGEKTRETQEVLIMNY